MIKVGSLVKMKWGYSPIGVVTKVSYPADHIVDVDPPQMASIVWPDIGKSREKAIDLEVISESR